LKGFMEHLAEYTRCASDFPYFCKEYVKIHAYEWTDWLQDDPRYPYTQNLRLHDYQEDCFNHVENNRFSIFSKFRQGGFSTLFAAYGLWRCMFRLDQSFLYLTQYDRQACDISGVVRYMLERLPQWMRPKMGKDNDHHKSFPDTGSKMLFHTCGAACGQMMTHLIIDEAAFITDLDKHWKALWPTLSCGGKAIVYSTLSNPMEWFYNMLLAAEKGLNDFKVYSCSIEEHPVFATKEWQDKMKGNLGEMGWNIEMLQQFKIESYNTPPPKPKKWRSLEDLL
jgi:hypothetical protein